jgi:peptidoglycan/LPS O-acetylase OafA/YrhL
MSVAEASRSQAPRAAAAQATRGFRPEVQGLRALAVLMVVSYHIWFGRVSGGVDVFLLISAFLLALSFLRKVDSGKPLDLTRHWLHQFKRLLPAVVVVILVTLGATYLFVPKSRWTDIIEQSWASLFYIQNWVLASNAVDYYADDHSLVSPLQHFWSLSVQGQVFILWPLLFLASSLLARRYRLRARGVVLLVFGVLFAASLGFSIWETYTNQAYAYFDTRARLWEFSFGTLLALALPYIRLPRFLRIVAGWVGLAAMVSGGFLLDVQGEFPGYVALWPLIAAALIIIAGQTASPLGADRFLSSKLLVDVGDLSYALYLWHWPVLVLFLIWRDAPAPGVIGGLVVIAISLGLAYVTMRFVERPLRALTWADRRRRRAVIVLAVCLGLVAAPLTVWQQSLRVEAERIAANALRNNPGAIALEPEFVNRSDADAPVVPAVARFEDEAVKLDGPCSQDNRPASDLLASGCGEIRPKGAGDKKIIVVGDSHSQQWGVPLRHIAEDEGAVVSLIFKGGCSFGKQGYGRVAECDEWNELAEEYIWEQDPDYVVSVGTAVNAAGREDVLPGFPEAARAIEEAGIDVVALRDNPRFDFSPRECVEKEGVDAAECNRDRALHLPAPVKMDELKRLVPSAAVIDLSDFICLPDSCPAVIGNVYVYLDTNHLTRTYLETLTREFGRQWKAVT